MTLGYSGKELYDGLLREKEAKIRADTARHPGKYEELIRLEIGNLKMIGEIGGMPPFKNEKYLARATNNVVRRCAQDKLRARGIMDDGPIE